MSKRYADVFDFILSKEEEYNRPIKLPTGKMWSMKDHVNRSTLYRDSDIVGEKDKFTPIKNITRPILNLQYRTEDIDVKDVDIYVDDKDHFHLSFLVKKYHDDVFVQEHDLDTFFDQLNQSRIDFGAGLSKSLSEGRECVPIQSIAFCDQHDILSRPIALKHNFAPDELLEMAKVGWGKSENGATATLQETITLVRENQRPDVSDGDIEIYELHGTVPKRFADAYDDSNEYETRLFIVALYQKKDSDSKAGIILFTKKEDTSPFKLIKRDPIYGRALGFGGAEELFEDQLWTNYAQRRKLDMMDSASKTVLGAIGPESATIATKNNLNDIDNNEILDLGNSDLKQIDTFPRNFRLFDNFVQEMETHAQTMGAAQDPIQGAEPQSGTPFASLQAQIQQSMGLHDYRRGQFAKHIEDLYREDFIPMIVKKITKGATFLSTLSLDELQYVTEALVRNKANDFAKDRILSGQLVTEEEVEAFKQKATDDFKEKGNKHFIEILKGEFKDMPLSVKVSVAGKSKNLGKAMDVITGVWRFAVSNIDGFMMLMQIKGFGSSFNQIMEYAGLSPVDFSGIGKIAEEQAMKQAQQMPQQQPQQLPAPQIQPAAV